MAMTVAAFASLAPASLQTAPELRSLVKPDVYKRARDDREIMSGARLEDAPRGTDARRYRYYVMTTVSAPLKLTRDTLTNYDLYPQMIPYVHKAMYSRERKSLQLEGGIWKFKMASTVEFEEKSPCWISYRVTAGHFKGLEGAMIFEDIAERGTMVYFSGEVSGSHWPPKLILERGAEIVFGYTARRMRSYIEELKEKTINDRERKRDERGEIPQPRRKL